MSKESPPLESSPPGRSYPAYLSMYTKGSSFEPIAAPARNMESEKLRRIRRRKQFKESRKYTRVFQYETVGDDKNYNLAAVLESLESSVNNASLHNSNTVNGSSGNAGSGCNGSTSKDPGKENRKDKKQLRRAPLGGRRRNNQQPPAAKGDSSSSSSEEEDDGPKDLYEEDEEDKMSSSSLVPCSSSNNALVVGHMCSSQEEEGGPLFKGGKVLERGLSKSSENLCQYSSDNLSSFTKVTNKRQKWKKKLAHSVDDNAASSQLVVSSSSSFAKPRVLVGSKPRPQRLDARDFPPLDPQGPKGSSSSVSSSSSSSVLAAGEELLPDVTTVGSSGRGCPLPDLTAQAVAADTSIAIALTEEEYRSQDLPLVIFGRGSDWTSKSECFEFGFEVNESLLASSSGKDPPEAPRDSSEESLLPLDRMDQAILSFGDSVTNLTVLGGEETSTTPCVSEQPTDSIQLPPYVVEEEEQLSFNYNEVINYLENAWLESLKDHKPTTPNCAPPTRRTPLPSSAY